MNIDKSLFLNSVPKSGTVLFSRLLYEFWVHENVVDDIWISEANIENFDFNSLYGKQFTGHLIFNTKTYAAIRQIPQILLLRNPVDTAFSYANFFASREMIGRSGLTDYIFKESINRKAVLRHIINGWGANGQSYPPLAGEWDLIASWHGLPGVKTVKYEDLIGAIAEIKQADGLAYFRDILVFIGRDRYSDEQIIQKVKSASSKENSATWRENIGIIDDGLIFPDEDDLRYVETYLSRQIERYSSL